MTIYVPWVLIAIFISLYYFYTYNRKNRERRNERREELNYKRKELLETILEMKKDKNDRTGETTD